jgi:DNA-binding MarR family transcriptional regulator
MMSSSARTLYLVKRAETACRSGLELCLSDLDMTPSQFTTMSLLAGRKDQSSADLARRAGVSPQSMSEIITLLERKALIVRSEDPQHRRILKIRLTDHGRKSLTLCQERADALETQLLDGLTTSEVEVLRRGLDQLARNRLALSYRPARAG